MFLFTTESISLWELIHGLVFYYCVEKMHLIFRVGLSAKLTRFRPSRFFTEEDGLEPGGRRGCYGTTGERF